MYIKVAALDKPTGEPDRHTNDLSRNVAHVKSFFLLFAATRRCRLHYLDELYDSYKLKGKNGNHDDSHAPKANLVHQNNVWTFSPQD